jgi:hypothetical protein
MFPCDRRMAEMRVLIRRHDGTRVEGVVLAASRYQMRVVTVDGSETEEYQRVDGIWYEESGLPIELEALMQVDGVDCAVFCSEVWAPTIAAEN